MTAIPHYPPISQICSPDSFHLLAPTNSCYTELSCLVPTRSQIYSTESFRLLAPQICSIELSFQLPHIRHAEPSFHL